MKASAKIGGERNRKVIDSEATAIEDLRVLLAIPEGKRFLWRLLRVCNLMESPLSATGNFQSALIGRQDVARQLMTWMAEVDPIAYPTLCIDMGRRETEEDT